MRLAAGIASGFGRVFASGSDLFDERSKDVLVPVDPLGRGHDNDDAIVVRKAYRARVLGSFEARHGSAIGVFERNGPVEPFIDRLDAAQSFAGFLLQKRQLFARQSGDVAEGHEPKIVK